MKPFLIKHLEGESGGRFPVWMMRQAGRYLPSYRAIREKHSFWEMVTTPSLAVEVSLLPLAVLPVDAVIFFSDILTLPYGLGVEIEMRESIGPVLKTPFANVDDFAVFDRYLPSTHTAFVGEALQAIRQKLPAETALIGFAGAPWTVASYLVQGQGKSGFPKLHQWMARDPKTLRTVLEQLSEATCRYLEYQIRSGAQVVQVFDTWVSEMPRAFFGEYYLPLLSSLIRRVQKAKVPVIYFSKQAHHVLDLQAQLGADVLSVDSLLSLREVEARVGTRQSLQGNLDPHILLGDEAFVRFQTRRLVQEAGGLSRPAILNLGHGILPQTPLNNAAAFVSEARQRWI